MRMEKPTRRIQEMADNDLIAKFITELSDEVFGELVSRYQSSIRQFLRRLTAGDHASADDLSQETFISMYSSLKSFRGESKLSTWLHKIAYHCFLKHEKNLRKYDFVGLEQTSESYNEKPVAPTEVLVEQLMAHLSRDERVTITLSYAAGMSHAEIAEVINMPLGTIKSHINRGKNKLLKHTSIKESAA